MKIHTAPEMPVTSGAWLLLARWRDQSLCDGWRFVRDWFVPEAEDVVNALMNKAPIGSAARRLGAARASRGVGIAETMTDLRSLFIASGLEVDHTALQETVVGWIEAGETDQQPSSCTDISTGLATLAHFERVLDDARRTSTSSSGLVVGRIQFPHMDRRLEADWTLFAEIGHICAREFSRDPGLQLFRHDSLHFLTTATAAGRASAVRCRSRLESIRDGALGRGDLQYRPLPGSDEETMALVSQLRRHI
ncbi:hypothetical protein [Arthrobacter sp. Y-9]|uniref:hypothetical protein n=1 Tax=Arthrobacter sp. Y-9 TaxID=3039385 RepID=UPI00241D2FB2|nr:hypothetical protein [Arthrobacter sp. Y-9]WFR84312.1 hypothetical protein P9849_01300 [Arthrobacter sp. Y-9]